MVKVIDHEDTEIILDNNVMLQMQEREINQQIATAKKYPRVLARAGDEMLHYATENEDTAQECVYALPRAGKVITGPTARFAEIVATSWGNSRYASRIIDEGQQFLTAQAVFHDLEKNIMISIEVPRRIIDSEGRRFKPDMIGVTASAAMSIAMRNAILKGVPRAVWGRAYDKCFAMIKGTVETIEARRTAALNAYKKLGVDQALVLQLLNVENIKEIEPDHLVILRGTLQAIKDGDTTTNAVFSGFKLQPEKNKADISGQIERGKKNGQKAVAQGEGGKPEGSKAAKEETQRQDDAKPGDDDGFPGDDTARDPVSQSGGSGNGDASGDVSSQTDPADGGNNGDSGSADQEQITQAPIPDGMIPDGEYSDSDLAALERLARALLDANSAKDINAINDRFTKEFESRDQETERSFAMMVAARRKAIRGSSAGKL